jgi:hypothetical protein
MLRPRLSFARDLACVLLCVLAPAAVVAAAQDAVTSASGPVTAAERRVREAVLARYRVLPVQNGIVLVPLSRIDGVDNIELRDGTIAINGHLATGGEVRERLGREAETVLELSYFDLPSQQRILLPGGGRAAQREPGAVTPEPAPPPRPPEEVETPAPAVPERSFRRAAEARVRVGGNITVAEDEQVNGAVVAVAGSVTINGRVREDVVAVGGNVHLGPRAEVRGDVTVVGGTIDRDPGATVGGRVNEVTFPFSGIRIRPNWSHQWTPWFDAGPWRAFRLLGSLLRMALLTLLATLVLLLAPRAVDRVQVAVTTQPWKSVLVGLLAQLFFIPVLILIVVVLAVSIIGIPLLVLVPFGILAFFVALLLGFTGAACGLARLVQHRSTWADPGGFAVLIVGLAMVWGITVLGRIVGLGGGPLAVFGALLVFVGFVIEYAVWTVGLGGALLTRFGRYGALPVVVPPVPPVSRDPLAEDVVPPPTSL